MTITVQVLDVGQGEAIIIDLPGDRFGLLDGGPRDDARDVLPHIHRRITAGMRFLFAGVTHWDRDHIAGLPTVLGAYKPESFVMPGIDVDLLERLCAAKTSSNDRAASERLRSTIAGLGVNVKGLLAQNQLTELGPDIIGYALSPSWSMREEVAAALSAKLRREELIRLGNRASLVLWLRVLDAHTLFLPGEVEADQYQEILANFRRRPGGSALDDPRASWLKLSHHGSAYNNPITLFQYFAQDNFVASASAGGRYGHPHPETLRMVHFQSGGRAMCTRLGQGCGELMASGGDPADPRWTGNFDWSGKPLPNETCYGTITVRVGASRRCTISTSNVQSKCPYGGPSRMPLRL